MQPIQWLEFELLKAYPLQQAVLCRQGGASSFPFNSLNLSFAVGDHPHCVEQNLEQVKQQLHIYHLLYAAQCHQDQFIEASLHTPCQLPVDALITAQKKLTLMIRHADCQAAIIYDPIHHVVANVHVGWKGNVLNMYQKIVHQMTRIYHSKPKELIACISPSLGPQCAEFKNFEKELPPSFWQFQIKPFYFDLWAISRWQLLEAGLISKNIEVMQQCTYTDENAFFSYRRDKRLTGRNGTIVTLL